MCPHVFFLSVLQTSVWVTDSHHLFEQLNRTTKCQVVIAPMCFSKYRTQPSAEPSPTVWRASAERRWPRFHEISALPREAKRGDQFSSEGWAASRAGGVLGPACRRARVLHHITVGLSLLGQRSERCSWLVCRDTQVLQHWLHESQNKSGV